MKNLIGLDNVWGLSPIDKSSIKHETDPGKLKKHRIKESFAEAIIPLGDEPLLRNRYINFQNSVSIQKTCLVLELISQIQMVMLHGPVPVLQHLGKFVSRINVEQRIRDVPAKRLLREPDENVRVLPHRPWHADVLEMVIRLPD